ncbi:MAG: flavodoxin domain-containing protein [Nitrososphaerota archaeon]|uniref:flavodoxin domain-containing protein n=1 Tax=Candidatus Bathycorpusculum sp. TaxID=2994959 RepID=UPI0028219FA6|nr:flavodoxin domain-containing protein [Candidatus Termitimicrobium sp.]MCL2431044.1 flavodoxin domain-containing protein [Candidatus Termitimicrobium sp.]MDR0493749.1 flavodoxin domain-containing protein [Nitrososphaerota archaeon]
MKKVLVLYYSRSGNTEKMANAVVEGAKSINGIEVQLSYHVEPQELTGYNAILVGTPTYRKEIPVEYKNLFEAVTAQGINLKDKTGAVFGSYGWSGEATRLVQDIMQKVEMRVTEQPINAKYIPDQATLEACRSLGKRVSENLMNEA